MDGSTWSDLNLLSVPTDDLSCPSDSCCVWVSIGADCLFRYPEGEAYITKILKDKQKLRIATQERERREEAFRKQHAEDSDADENPEEAAAKKAKFEESKAGLQEKMRAQAGPPIFKQALFPVQVRLYPSCQLAKSRLTLLTGHDLASILYRCTWNVCSNTEMYALHFQVRPRYFEMASSGRYVDCLNCTTSHGNKVVQFQSK